MKNMVWGEFRKKKQRRNITCANSENMMSVDKGVYDTVGG